MDSIRPIGDHVEQWLSLTRSHVCRRLTGPPWSGLNHAPPLMRHRAIGEGKRLVERDRDERVRLETRAILDYLDTAPLRAELGRGVRQRMKEGRFGRRQSG
jgi:hypothetical protein